MIGQRFPWLRYRLAPSLQLRGLTFEESSERDKISQRMIFLVAARAVHDQGHEHIVLAAGSANNKVPCIEASREYIYYSVAPTYHRS